MPLVPVYAATLLSFFIGLLPLLKTTVWSLFVCYGFKLALFYVGLRYGRREAVLSGGLYLGLDLTAMISGVVPFSYFLIGIQNVSLSVLMMAVFLTKKRKNAYKFDPSHVLEVATLFSVVSVVFPHTFALDLYKTLLEEFFKHQPALVSTLPFSIEFIVTFIPSGLALLMVSVQFLWFRLMQNALFSKKKSARKAHLVFGSLVSPWWDIVAVGSFMTVLVCQYFESLHAEAFCKGLLLLSAYNLFAQGLFILKSLPMQKPWVRGSYLFLIISIFFLVWPALFVVLLGAMEPWYRLSDRVKNYKI